MRGELPMDLRLNSVVGHNMHLGFIAAYADRFEKCFKIWEMLRGRSNLPGEGHESGGIEWKIRSGFRSRHPRSLEQKRLALILDSGQKRQHAVAVPGAVDLLVAVDRG